VRAFGKRRPKRLLCITHATTRRDQQGFDLRIAFDDNSSIEAILSFEAVEGSRECLANWLPGFARTMNVAVRPSARIENPRPDGAASKLPYRTTASPQ